MSLPKELQELQEKRAQLEDESLTLKEQQKKLEERAKALEQKIMEELKSKNDETRQNISHLESRINDLEQRLGQITQKTKTTEQANEPPSPSLEANDGVSAQINDAVLEEPAEEGEVAVTAVDDSSDVDEPYSSEPNQGTEKKKRRFL
jgi:chromosome segregation ATPase